MLFSWEKLYLKDINSYYIYWDILHLPNVSNNKLLYLVILLLTFAKYLISINECLIQVYDIKFMIFEAVRSK